MSRRDRGVELAAVRLTEEFIVFGKVNHVGVDAYIAPAGCTRFIVILRQIRYFPWVDVGIDPYAFFEI